MYLKSLEIQGFKSFANKIDYGTVSGFLLCGFLGPSRSFAQCLVSHYQTYHKFLVMIRPDAPLCRQMCIRDRLGAKASWWSIPIGWGIGFAIGFVRYLSGKWQKSSLIE